jgi:hypothetical protein
MIRSLLLLMTTLTLLHFPQDVKVATWSAGTPDTDGYESLAFWIKDDHRAYIRYTHGKDSDDTELTWLGPDSLSGRRGFRAGFPAPDNRTLFISPDGDSLSVLFRSNNQRLYREKFHWENESGQGDSTATCDICAQSQKQAAAWLQKYFWK